MDALRSWEFLFALVCFMTPASVAAVLVYQRVVNSRYRRELRGARLTAEQIQRLSQPVQPLPSPAATPQRSSPAPAVVPGPAKVAPQPSFASFRQPLENLRLRLEEFRGSIRNTSDALQRWQDCDCRFSMDLTRLSETMEHAFPVEPKPSNCHVLPRRDVTPAA